MTAKKSKKSKSKAAMPWDGNIRTVKSDISQMIKGVEPTVLIINRELLKKK